MAELSPEVKEELKALAEKCSVEAVESAFKIAEICIKATPNKIDDLLLTVFPFVKKYVAEQVDKISTEV